MAGPIPYPEHPYPGMPPSAYPATMPPPVNYPKAPRRKRFVLIGGVVLVVAVVTAVVLTVTLNPRSHDAGTVTVTTATATTAIQGYLDALSKGDDETIARNNSCGFFDAVKDRRSDMTLANLTSDAFRRQYGQASVSSIDEIVVWSPTQSQVLFTMRAATAGRSQGEVERQGIAQLLLQHNKILVCSYLPRTTGQF